MYVVELMSSCLVVGASKAAGHTTAEVDCTALPSLGFILKKIFPRTEERPKPLGHLKSPQRLTASNVWII